MLKADKRRWRVAFLIALATLASLRDARGAGGTGAQAPKPDPANREELQQLESVVPTPKLQELRPETAAAATQTAAAAASKPATLPTTRPATLVSAIVSVDGRFFLEEQQPSLAEEIAKDGQVREKARAAYVAKYEREVERLKEVTRVFDWQHVSTIVVFFFAHLLLIAGLAAAWSEFASAAALRRAAQTQPATTPRAETQPQPGAGSQPSPERVDPIHELQLGLQGVALKTSLHGLLILLVAMGFYFLYLKFVYPISAV